MSAQWLYVLEVDSFLQVQKNPDVTQFVFYLSYIIYSGGL